MTMKSALFAETAMALIGGVGLGPAPGAGGLGVAGDLIAVQVGSPPALMSLLRQRLKPPASILLGSFGSRMKGAMKLAPLKASIMPVPAHGPPFGFVGAGLQ